MLLLGNLQMLKSLRIFWLLLLLCFIFFSEKYCVADEQPPLLTPDQIKNFMAKLATFVGDNHIRTNKDSMQHGMTYEYRDMRKEKAPECFVQGEALDTMHDGAWFGSALVNASLATGGLFLGEPVYRNLLEKNVLPFYCRILNHSDKIFSSKTNHARPSSQKLWSQSKEWLFQEGEKGFVPYWWDDGGSVSLERMRDKNPLPAFPSFDQFLQDKIPNPNFVLSGYSLGSSNHLAQDLGVLLQLSWLYYRNYKGMDGDCFRTELSDSAKNLQASRMRHHGHIPMCDAPAALVLADPAFLRLVPDASIFNLKLLNNHYSQALAPVNFDQKYSTPGFADEQQYLYYSAIARHGKLPKAAAFKLVYDAYTQPKLYKFYSDDLEVQAGINRFDLHPIYYQAGKPMDYRSERKGPSGKPRPTGSRFGPQNMVQSALALQALQHFPDLWDSSIEVLYPKIARVEILDPVLNTNHLKPTQLKLGNSVLILSATQTSLLIKATIPASTQKILLVQTNNPNQLGCSLEINKEGKLEARNFLGQILKGKFNSSLNNDSRTIDVEIPTSVIKTQIPWMNCIELSKYSFKIENDAIDFILTTNSQSVKISLEREVTHGLANWYKIFNSKGFIPTALDSGSDWDFYSDTGGYAHLISACSQYLNYLQGKRDWELLEIPTFIEPIKK